MWYILLLFNIAWNHKLFVLPTEGNAFPITSICSSSMWCFSFFLFCSSHISTYSNSSRALMSLLCSCYLSVAWAYLAQFIMFQFKIVMFCHCMQKIFSFIVRDSLINVGPLRDFSYGLRINADPNATGIAKQSNYELVGYTNSSYIIFL